METVFISAKELVKIVGDHLRDEGKINGKVFLELEIDDDGVLARIKELTNEQRDR